MKWAWREYRSARLFRNEKSMIEEAFRIRVLQAKAGVKVSAFPELGIAWPPFLELEDNS